MKYWNSLPESLRMRVLSYGTWIDNGCMFLDILDTNEERPPIHSNGFEWFIKVVGLPYYDEEDTCSFFHTGKLQTPTGYIFPREVRRGSVYSRRDKHQYNAWKLYEGVLRTCRLDPVAEWLRNNHTEDVMSPHGLPTTTQFFRSGMIRAYVSICRTHICAIGLMMKDITAPDSDEIWDEDLSYDSVEDKHTKKTNAHLYYEGKLRYDPVAWRLSIEPRIQRLQPIFFTSPTETIIRRMREIELSYTDARYYFIPIDEKTPVYSPGTFRQFTIIPIFFARRPQECTQSSGFITQSRRTVGTLHRGIHRSAISDPRRITTNIFAVSYLH